MSRARPIRPTTVKLTAERMYDLIRYPVVTEKSTAGSAHGQVTFRVPVDASKPEIKAAIEGVFKVKVVAVNTLRQEGKVKRFRGIFGKRAEYKKAMVTLAEGQSIDVSTGV
jgi:large subunit ribosomal protein L23